MGGVSSLPTAFSLFPFPFQSMRLSIMPIQHFFLRGKYIGKAKRSDKELRATTWGGEVPYPAAGVAYFCPKCAELWFNSPIEEIDSRVLSVICDRHSESEIGGVPGLIWNPSRGQEFLRTLPTSLISRDFLLRLAALEKSGELKCKPSN